MDRLNGADATSRRESFARLNHNCMAIGLWMNDEDNTMKLEELKALSTKELTALYNQYADKQVKRMESRAKLEERTAQLLRDNQKLEEGSEVAGDEVSSPVPTPAPTNGKGKPAKPPIEAEATTEEEDADMAKNATAKKTTKTTAKKTAAAKPAKPAKTAPAKKDAAAAGKRGAPLTDHTYIAISEKSKDFNPRGYKPQAESMRNKVYQEIKNSDGGKTRTQLEKKFGELGSVKAQLDVLVKLQFIKTA